MVVTVYGGDKDLPGVVADDEARAIWKKVTGFTDDRVIGLGKKDNFWQMGETGPMGPCTEIHFNYDANGAVDTVDFNLLASNFGKVQPADSSGAATPAFTPAADFGELSRAARPDPVAQRPAWSETLIDSVLE